MRLFSARMGLTILAMTAVVLCVALAAPRGSECEAQQSASDPVAPELTIDLPAPAKPGKPAAVKSRPAARVDDATIVGGSPDGAAETAAPQAAPAKPARKSAPTAGKAAPATDGDRAPTPFDSSPAAEAAASQPALSALPAAQPEKAPTPFDPSQVKPPVAAAAASASAKPAPVVFPGSPISSGSKVKQARNEEARSTASTAPRRIGEMTVGALFPLTGANQARGQAAQAALELAKQDIGDYFAKVNAAGGLAILIEDTQSSPKVALERLKGLLVRGVRVVIGPDFDDELAEVREFAKANGMLLLSPGSAGPFLTKKEGEFYRFAPMNTHQAEAVAGLAAQEGVDALVPIWEGDLYGDELVVHLKAHFRNMGGTVLAGVRYRQGAAQFAGYLTDLKAQIAQAQKQFKKIAIYFAGREGIAAALKEAAALGLTAYRWYGCDNTALSPELTRDEATAALVQTARLVSPRYGETETEVYGALEKRIQEKTKEFPAAECVVAYDVAWLVAVNGLACAGLDNFDAFRAALPATAERFRGVSGWMALDDNGDRREDWGYDFWSIKKDNSRYYWEKFARYQFQPGGTKQFFINNPE
ncbi:MAG: ABC transporter substrate-binding protein [Desulfovibrionaceae bacterium]|nr:ABC transporter substrate-binding protein [Desulfovibrionaceae bacterium]MBF0512716.1 ABC transporter substrate-binding protein [Desulfovibrionaceae bacterium]